MKGLLFTYALTYGGALASLVNPYAGLQIYICFAIVCPETMWHWAVPVGNYSRVVAIALLAGWAMNGFGDWNFGRAKPMVYALSGFMLWATASAMVAPSPDAAWGFVESKAKIVLPCLVGFTVIDSFARLTRMAWVIMLSQGFVAYEFNMSYFAGNNRLHSDGFGGLDNNCVAIAMVTGAGLAFFLGLAEARIWRRWLAFGIAGLMVHAVLFSFSRGGMLALLVTGLATFLILPKTPKNLGLYSMAVVIGLMMAGPEVVERFDTAFAGEEERDESAQSRLDLWSACWDLMLKQPVLGAGPDHFPLVAPAYGFPLGKEAHSLWLQLGAELGFVGVGSLAAYYLVCMARLGRVVRSRLPIDTDLRDTARMVIVSLTGFVVAAQFVSLEGLELPYYVALLGGGVLKLASRADLSPVGFHNHLAPVV